MKSTLASLTMIAVLPAALAAQTFTITGGNPGALQIKTAIAGQPPTGKVSGPINYNIKGRNNRTYKITARLNTVMPSGVTLQVHMTAPTGAA